METEKENLERFVAKHLKLLKIERNAERENLKFEKKQQSLVKWKSVSDFVDIKGNTVVHFERIGSIENYQSQPDSTIGPVEISFYEQLVPGKIAQLSGVIVQGNVIEVSEIGLSIVISTGSKNLNWDDDTEYDITVASSNVSLNCMKRCLRTLGVCNSHLKDVLFGECLPDEPLSKFTYPDGQEMELVNPELNASQKEVIDFALKQKDVALIHGPPGTGKTTIIAELIIQSVKAKQLVLTCAPSNVAIDNLVERLVKNKIKVVRLGHPDRTMPHLRKCCLDQMLSTSSFGQSIKATNADICSLLLKLRKVKSEHRRHTISTELVRLKRELSHLIAKAEKEVLSRAEVILSTLISASIDGPLGRLDSNYFHLVVIDECAQAIEAACWVSLTNARKCILAGDHLQLPPTVISKRAAKDGLGLSLMERVLDMYRHNSHLVVRMLTIQCRMNERIMAWSSKQFYENRIKSDPSVKSRLLSHMASIKCNEDTSIPLLLIDTTGCDFRELSSKGMSKANKGEAAIVYLHVQNLISSGVSADDIGIISPYKLQVKEIALRVHAKYPQLEINSVDGFQGREKEAIIISLVRTNSEGKIGFLSEYRRMNVAVTRAKRHLAVICDCKTFSHDETLKSFMDYVADQGEVRSASVYDYGKLYNEKKEKSKPKSKLKHSKANRRASDKSKEPLTDKTHVDTAKQNKKPSKDNVLKEQSQDLASNVVHQGSKAKAQGLVTNKPKDYLAHKRSSHDDAAKQNKVVPKDNAVREAKTNSQDLASKPSSDDTLVHQGSKSNWSQSKAQGLNNNKSKGSWAHKRSNHNGAATQKKITPKDNAVREAKPNSQDLASNPSLDDSLVHQENNVEKGSKFNCSHSKAQGLNSNKSKGSWTHKRSSHNDAPTQKKIVPKDSAVREAKPNSHDLASNPSLGDTLVHQGNNVEKGPKSNCSHSKAQGLNSNKSKGSWTHKRSSHNGAAEQNKVRSKDKAVREAKTNSQDLASNPSLEDTLVRQGKKVEGRSKSNWRHSKAHGLVTNKSKGSLAHKRSSHNDAANHNKAIPEDNIVGEAKIKSQDRADQIGR